MQSLLNNTRRPDITFYRNGRIDVSARIAKILGVHDGDVLNIAIQGSEYFLYVQHKADRIVGRHEAQCYPSNRLGRNNNNLRCHSKRLCNLITGLHNEATVVRLPVGAPLYHQQLGTILPIITRYNIIK